MPASPYVPGRRPFQCAPCAWAQSSSRITPSDAQSSAIFSISNAMCPPMWTTHAALGLCSYSLRSKSSNETQRSSRLQSTQTFSPPAAIVASGVAMKVFDGQSTFSPRTPAQSSAASAPPVQLAVATASQPFHCAQVDSKRSTIPPSDQRPESRTSSQSAWRRARPLVPQPIPTCSQVSGITSVPHRGEENDLADG